MVFSPNKTEMLDYESSTPLNVTSFGKVSFNKGIQVVIQTGEKQNSQYLFPLLISPVFNTKAGCCTQLPTNGELETCAAALYYFHTCPE